MNNEKSPTGEVQEDIVNNQEFNSLIAESTDESTPIPSAIVDSEDIKKAEDNIAEIKGELVNEFEAKPEDITLAKENDTVFEATKESISSIGENPLEVAIRVRDGEYSYTEAFYMTIDDEGKTYGDEKLSNEEIEKGIKQAQSSILVYEEQKKRYGGISNKTLFKLRYMFTAFGDHSIKTIDDDTEMVRDAEIGIKRLNKRIKYLKGRL